MALNTKDLFLPSDKTTQGESEFMCKSGYGWHATEFFGDNDALEHEVYCKGQG